MMRYLHRESQRPSLRLMDCRRTVKLSRDRAHRQRFGRLLNWNGTIMFTMEVHVTEHWSEHRVSATGQEQLHAASTSKSAEFPEFASDYFYVWKTDRRRDSRALRRRIVHQGILQTPPSTAKPGSGHARSFLFLNLFFWEKGEGEGGREDSMDSKGEGRHDPFFSTCEA